jgi:predicted amidohydrolase/predicted N-acetyltransferase YhbS
MTDQTTRPRLNIRELREEDIDDIVALSKRIYGADANTPELLKSQLSLFPQGQFVAVYGEKIVGHVASFRISETRALEEHCWEDITANGMMTNHDPEGDMLYGMEIEVDPAMQGLRIGQRLYNRRKELCEELELKGIVLVGRLPGYNGHFNRTGESPERYVERIINREITERVINFQQSNDFEFVQIMHDYLEEDAQSRQKGALMVWRNPKLMSVETPQEVRRGRIPDSVRVCTVQYGMRKVDSIDEFEQQVEYYVDVASDYGSDFVVFPEMLTLQLLSASHKPLRREEAMREITDYTERFTRFMSNLSVSYNINIIGGSHPTMDEEQAMRNVAYIFLRDGQIHSQEKIHPTPNERYWWNLQGGERAEAIMTDCGPIGVMICYDSEFPELARHLVNQGAMILFVPFCTDERQGYLRVRYCCQARAVENQCYVVTSGVVGNMPNVENMDIHYAESGIFTPCDFAFARDGIAAITPSNTETVAFADLRMEDLIMARNSGTVTNLKDRRDDLYQLHFASAPSDQQ